MANELEQTNQLSFNKDTVELIKKTVAPGLKDNELQLFLYTAQRFGLDPLARQIYAIKRGDRMTIQTGIDGFRVVANRNGLAGIDDAIFDDESNAHPNKATVTVHRWMNGQRIPFTASARWSEYTVDNSPIWKKMPYAMLAKCAESLSLRKGFPAELSGVYTDEEMMQAGDKPIEPEIDIATVLSHSFTLKSGTFTVKELLSTTDGRDKLKKLSTMTSGKEKAIVDMALAMPVTSNDKPVASVTSSVKDVTPEEDDSDLPFTLV